MADVKTRNWLFLFYPESAPDDWQGVIESWQVGVMVSPVHDSDLTADGTLKKPHYHGILLFDGPQSYKRAMGLVSQLGCATCKPCNSLCASARYLCHLDSPDKFQYEISDILCFGPVDLGVLEKKGESEVDNKVEQLINIIIDNCITEFSELVNYVIKEQRPLLATLRGNTLFFRSYLASRRGIERDR